MEYQECTLEVVMRPPGRRTQRVCIVLGALWWIFAFSLSLARVFPDLPQFVAFGLGGSLMWGIAALAAPWALRQK